MREIELGQMPLLRFHMCNPPMEYLPLLFHPNYNNLLFAVQDEKILQYDVKSGEINCTYVYEDSGDDVKSISISLVTDLLSISYNNSVLPVRLCSRKNKFDFFRKNNFLLDS